MSSYWIDLDGCQQIINDLNGILANDNTHFTGLDVDKDSVDTGTYGTDETDQVQDSALRTNAVDGAAGQGNRGVRLTPDRHPCPGHRIGDDRAQGSAGVVPRGFRHHRCHPPLVRGRATAGQDVLHPGQLG